MIRPCLSCVRALKVLQNSMMLTPCWPSAGPTGGAGFACPAGHCSFTTATTFFAMLSSSHECERTPKRPPRVQLFASSRLSPSRLLDGDVVEHHGRRAPEYLHHHADLLLVRVHLIDEAREVREGAAHDAHALAFLEHDPRLRFRRAFLHLRGHLGDVGLGDRRRPVAAAHEAGDLRRVLDDVPGLVRQVHLHQDVAREELALRGAALALHHLDHVLLRDQDLVEVELVMEALRPLEQRLLHLRFVPGVRMDDVPLLVRHRRSDAHLTNRSMPQARAASITPSTTVKKATMITTPTVPPTYSR